MKRVFLILVITINFCFSQNDSISRVDYERVYIELGIIQPLGKLATKFDASPSFGFWFRNRLVREDYIDFGFNFFIPNNPKSIDFKYRDSIVKYKSDYFGISIGTRFSKNISMSNQTKNLFLEWNSGIGVALNFYQAPKELVFENGEFTREVLTTFYLSQGIKLNYKNIGFQCIYNFSPYDLFNDKINIKYGSQSLLFGLVYRQ